ncbi:MAG: site-specific DNA-methyltransferase [Sulfuricella sp.]
MPTLDWLNRAEALTSADKIPYRVLEPVSEFSSPLPQAGYPHPNLLPEGEGAIVKGACSDLGPGERVTSGENLLIQGDNLDALKALLPFYRGRVKCIFIDPPYNTKSAFEHYDDNLEHSQWLSMMYPRLVLLRELLAEDGSIWVTIDDNEGHYLKVLMDEVFGRGNFVDTVIWQKADSPRNSARQFSSDHDYMYVYSKAPDWIPTKLERTEEANSIYTNPDNDERGPWLPGDPYANKPYSRGQYAMLGPTGRTFTPPPGRFWRISEERLRELDAEGRVWWGPTGGARPSIKRYLSEVGNLVPRTFWSKDDVGSNRTSKNEMRAIFPDAASFTTPKPERLLKRVLEIATNPGDLVLDSFLGSGTTAAVAHKMGRRWIGIEMGDHAATHCIPRMQKVIAGEQGGISQAVNWQGGGGFRFLRLGEPMFNADGSIHPAVRFATLASFVWMQETGAPLALPVSSTRSPGCSPTGGRGEQINKTPLLGVHEGRGIYLLFNGILGDKRPASGNVLTNEVLATIERLFPHDGAKIIYGEACRLGAARLAAAGVTFKHIPYDVKAR